MNYSRSVDEYLEKSRKWNGGLRFLRNKLLNTELTETVKWGAPVYTINNKNVVGLGGFKDFISIWFYQGVFLSDPEKKLINAQEGTTRGLRQLRFTSITEIERNLEIILQYVEEAIQNQKEGKEIEIKRKELIVPEELTQELTNKNLIEVFEELSLSKKRDFAEYISSAKQDETKWRRLEKILPMIENGIGLNDKYK